MIIYYLTSNLDPYWTYADYSLYIYREKTLFKKTIQSISPPFKTRLLSAYKLPIVLYYLTF